MKSLDEVIDGMERCSKTNCFDCNGCPYEDDDAETGCYSDDMERDALHYLKLFQADCERVRGQLEDLKQEYRPNDPLTWDELRQMEGKPVWVELKRKETEVGRKAWGLNDGTYVDAFGYDIVTVKVLHDLWHLSKAQLGKTWQAYRKERE